MKTLKLGVFSLLLLFSFNAHSALILGDSYADSNGDIWEYIGSWSVNDGPQWSLTPNVNVMFNGVEAAEFLFGPLAAGFVYATSSNDSGVVDHMANYDGWGITSNTILAEGYVVDRDGDGFYESDTGAPYSVATSDMSAFISDHGNSNVNYAFAGQGVAAVPAPPVIALLGVGIFALGFSRRNKSV